jgi:8-oxo-dGTP pyrophosphatase MutT (NUDIX family)
MHRATLLTALDAYESSSLIQPVEHDFKKRCTEFIAANPECFERSNKGHITGAAWIINKAGTKALLTHHKKLSQWFQLGGHADGDFDIKRVALKEAQEESGLESLRFLQEGIFDIDIHPIPGACHFHYDIRFLLQADSHEFTVSDESHALAWVDLDQLEQYSTEQSILRMAQKGKLFQ